MALLEKIDENFYRHQVNFVHEMSRILNIPNSVFKNKEQIIEMYFKICKALREELMWSRNHPLSYEYLEELRELNKRNILPKHIKVILESI